MRLNGILPPEATSNTPRIVLTGREHLLIEEHEGLISYDSDCIRLRIKGSLLVISGQNLIIGCFGGQEVTVKGAIRSLEFIS